MEKTILTYFGINCSQVEVDFYNALLDEDNYIFINPFLIRNSNSSFCELCQQYVASFMNELIGNIKKDKEYSIDLLSKCGEVNEIRLGMSTGLPKGNGIGIGNATNIVEAILESEALKGSLLNEVSDLGLFIKNIDKDKMSDMTANLILEPLCNYTKEQCDLLNIPTQKKPLMFWNKAKCCWDEKNFDLPFYGEKVVIFVPKSILIRNSIYSFSRFVGIYISDYYRDKYITEERNFVEFITLKNGQRKPKLSKLKALEVLKEEETVDKDFIARFAKDNPKVYARFKEEAIQKTAFNVDEIGSDNLESIIKVLKNEFKNIKPGNDQSKEYQMLVARIVELAFYPELSYPKIEYEINEGRKRIDISFRNTANKGFFNLLDSYYSIPSNNIFIECKNYSQDIANPELDQMIGRFSVNKGKFGIICCRKLDDEETFIKREIDTFNQDQGYIIHFTDDDLITLLDHCSDKPFINDFLKTKLERVILK